MDSHLRTASAHFGRRLALFMLAAGAVWASLPSGVLHAQNSGDLGDAATAYDRGAVAYRRGDFSEAARWFETAHSLAPAAGALVQAVRAHDEAGNHLTAASLALQLRDRYPEDGTAQSTASAVIQEHASSFGMVDIQCVGCTLTADGGLLPHPTFFVRADTPTEILVHFDSGDVAEMLLVSAGDRYERVIEAPEAGATDTPTPTGITPRPDPEDPEFEEAGGTPLWLTLVTGGFTLVAGGVLTWSAIDMFDGVPAYEANPSPTLLVEGQNRETRTEILIAVTGGLGLLTVVLLAMTDFGSGEEEPSAGARLAPSVSLADGYAGFDLAGEF